MNIFMLVCFRFTGTGHLCLLVRFSQVLNSIRNEHVWFVLLTSHLCKNIFLCVYHFRLVQSHTSKFFVVPLQEGSKCVLQCSK